MRRIQFFRLLMVCCLMTVIAAGVPVAHAQGGTPGAGSRGFIYQNGQATDLGSLPGATGSEPHAINNLGEVVGASGGHAFSWTAQTGMTDLNSLLPSGSTWVLQSANDVNDIGQITGTMLVGGALRGFVLTPGAGGGPPTTIDVGILPGSASSPDAFTEPLGINAAGDVVGRALGPNVNDPGGSLIAVPFLYSGGTLTNFGAFAGAPMSGASDINNSGVITGESDRALPPAFNVEHRAFQVTLPSTVLQDLGDGAGAGINDSGQIVGVNGTGHAALFSGGTVTDLGTLPGGSFSFANAINNATPALIVGDAQTADQRHDHAIVFSAGTVTEINALAGFENSAAFDVNDSGQIVGVSFTPINTPLGDSVVTPVDLATGSTAPATLAFSGVTQPGFTGVTIGPDGPPAPSGFSLGTPPTYFDFFTDAVFTQVVVCITDGSVTATSRLLHFDVNGVATDVTQSLNLITHTICSQALTSLSPFAIATTNVVVDTSAPVTTPTVTPTPNTAGWNRVPVAVSLQAVDPDGAADVAGINYSATGAQPISATTATGDHASVVISAEGVTTLSFSSQDRAGNTEATHSLTIRIDQTSPVVTYSGNAGTYTVDQAVAITCTATDPANANGTPGSGLASTTCHNVTGPAYTFGVGSHSFSAAAADNAGNAGSGSATFNVQVTLGSLCLLTKQFAETSSTFVALPPARQASWDTFFTQVCGFLAAASAKATPKQKAQLIAAYQSVLPWLVRNGLLTSVQAATLLALSKMI